MRTAFLILAHDQPIHLGRLAWSVRHSQTRVFVHIDRRSGALEPFRAQLPPGVEFVAARRPVRWGGMSVLTATLDLLRAAVQAGADRYVLLSGSDQLARPLSELLAELDSPTQYLRIDRSLEPGVLLHRHVSRLHLNDLDSRLARRISGRLPRLRRQPMPFVQGSQWWALTDACARHVLARLDADPRIGAFLARSHCPDEIGISSIVADSEFADRISDDHRKHPGPVAGRYALHYIDWADRVALSPRVLDESDLSAVLESGAFFARKIRLPQSQRLVHELSARTEESRYAR